jgi:hypothetical protein
VADWEEYEREISYAWGPLPIVFDYSTTTSSGQSAQTIAVSSPTPRTPIECHRKVKITYPRAYNRQTSATHHDDECSDMLQVKLHPGDYEFFGGHDTNQAISLATSPGKRPAFRARRPFRTSGRVLRNTRARIKRGGPAKVAVAAEQLRAPDNFSPEIVLDILRHILVREGEKTVRSPLTRHT